MATRSGFVALAGRPNVGKSTLVNAIVGHKVAIVSDKPQTTRRAIRGVATREDAQLVLTDLPGVQRPLDNLTERMQRRVERELADSDAALLVLNGEDGVGPGDRFIAGALRGDLHLLCDVARLQPIDLVQRDHDGSAERENTLGDEAVAGADALACREHEQDRIDIFERPVDRALHPLGEWVLRPLKAGQVGERELVVAGA